MSRTSAEQVWATLLSLVLERNDRRKDASRELRMSYIKVKALRRVAREPLTMRELTERLTTDRPYTTLVVDDLERRGLVARSAHPGDRRCKVVTATPAGLAAAAVADKIMVTPPAELAALDGPDLAELARILGKLTADERPAGN